jgi:paraquat-inducible protein B
MGKRVNPAAIGGFIVGAVVLIIVGILLFSRSQWLTEKRTLVMYFEGSVKGLNVGAPVDFQGVRVGAVTDIRVRYIVKDEEFRIPVFIEIEPDRFEEVGVREAAQQGPQFIKSLIDRGLRAQLDSQSLVTGQLFVQLGLHPDTPVRLVGSEGEVPELPTIPTSLQQASQAAQDVLDKLRQLPLDQLFANVLGITQGLNRLVNAPEASALMRSLEGSSATVQQLLQRIDGQITPLLDDAGGTSHAARALMTDLQQVVRQVNARVGPLADGVKETLEAARATLKDGQQLTRQVDARLVPLLESLSATSKTAQGSLVQTQRLLDTNMATTLQEAAAATRAFRVLADYLERNPSALVYGKGGDRR